jgi:SnoaL-like domain
MTMSEAVPGVPQVPAVDPGELRLWLDKLAISELVRTERFARDRGDWAALTEAYLPDSRVRTTWFEGTGAEFAEASRDMAEKGRHSKHPIWPIEVRVNGDRALAESHAEIQNRSVIDGVEVDMTQYCRFFSQVVRTGAGWRFLSFEAIYCKDTIAACDPARSVPIDWSELAGLRPSYRIWAWAMARRGYPVKPDLLGDDRPDLVGAFHREMDAWLAGG